MEYFNFVECFEFVLTYNKHDIIHVNDILNCNHFNTTLQLVKIIIMSKRHKPVECCNRNLLMDVYNSSLFVPILIQMISGRN